jgi:hypothetical protein
MRKSKPMDSAEIKKWIEDCCMRAFNTPIWKITQDGMDKWVKWTKHVPNPRFGVYGSGTPGVVSDDLVLDKETGLIWTRNANPIGERNWLDSNTLCREFTLGNRLGWRLPAVEELSTLVDPQQSNPALPVGHPFINVQYGPGISAYWSSTNYENPSAAAWFVNVGEGKAGLANKATLGYVWPVRGGRGGNNWNW